LTDSHINEILPVSDINVIFTALDINEILPASDINVIFTALVINEIVLHRTLM